MITCFYCEEDYDEEECSIEYKIRDKYLYFCCYDCFDNWMEK